MSKKSRSFALKAIPAVSARSEGSVESARNTPFSRIMEEEEEEDEEEELMQEKNKEEVADEEQTSDRSDIIK